MSTLALWSLVMGLTLVVLHGTCLVAPQKAGVWIRGFPRHRVFGWLLAAIDLLWSAWLILEMPLGGIEKYKPIVYVAAPALFLLIVFLMDELLAARALGALFLLLPAPLLDAERWHPSGFRLVIAVLAYALAIKGMVLVLSPYTFRKTMEWLLQRQTLFRAWNAAGAALGIFLVVLSLTVF